MKVLFLCTGNSCRSQMAEGYARQVLPADWAIYSAGIEAHGMNPFAIAVMAADGIDIRTQHSKTVDEVPWMEMDLIITLCHHASQSCPVLPVAAQVMHWDLADPALARGTDEAITAIYAATRDEIRHRMQALRYELASETP